MKLTSRTEYGLISLMHLTAKPAGVPITTTEIVESEHFSKTFTEKILQQLRAAGILNSVQGHQGGYVLARPAKDINLKEIVEALEGNTFQVFCDPKPRAGIVCNHFTLCGLKPVWTKARHMLDEYFSSVTLEQIGTLGRLEVKKTGESSRKKVRAA